uniref:Uncharacterized protein n=1 Tax=Rhizophora mucronata TaxID=61149 RepID=A0A2P2PIX9_RHIMU
MHLAAIQYGHNNKNLGLTKTSNITRHKLSEVEESCNVP